MTRHFSPLFGGGSAPPGAIQVGNKKKKEQKINICPGKLFSSSSSSSRYIARDHAHSRSERKERKKKERVIESVSSFFCCSWRTAAAAGKIKRSGPLRHLFPPPSSVPTGNPAEMGELSIIITTRSQSAFCRVDTLIFFFFGNNGRMINNKAGKMFIGQ